MNVGIFKGWGTQMFGGSMHDKLHELEVEIVSKEVCKEAMEGYDVS